MIREHSTVNFKQQKSIVSSNSTSSLATIAEIPPFRPNISLSSAPSLHRPVYNDDRTCTSSFPFFDLHNIPPLLTSSVLDFDLLVRRQTSTCCRSLLANTLSEQSSQFTSPLPSSQVHHRSSRPFVAQRYTNTQLWANDLPTICPLPQTNIRARLACVRAL